MLKSLIGIAATVLLLSGCGKMMDRINEEKKQDALKRCLAFSGKEAKQKSQRTKIINECMDESGYSGYDYDLQGQ